MTAAVQEQAPVAEAPNQLIRREFAPYAVTRRVEIQTRTDGRFMIVLFGEYIPKETLMGGRLILEPSASRVSMFVRHYMDDTFDEGRVLIAECPDPKPELLEVCRAHEFLDVLIYDQTDNPLKFQNLIAWVDEE